MTRSADNAIGMMMDTAYFVGRQQLLIFFNELLDLNLTKIEHTASGAVACQLTEYIFPGSIPLSRINWEARSDYEFVSNYKLLQAAFTKYSVKRYVDVDKLIRAKYQDNLEFCQWLKAFYDQSGAHREGYDGRVVRAKGKGGRKYNDSVNKVATKVGSSKPVSRGTKPATTFPTKSRVSTRPAPLKASENKARPVNTNIFTKNPAMGKTNTDMKLKKINIELESRISELESSVGDIEKERDFYFGKLRSIELYLQIKQDKKFDGFEMDDVVRNIFKVLYATVDDDVLVDEDGEVVPTMQGSSKDDISADLSDALGSKEVPNEPINGSLSNGILVAEHDDNIGQ
eukprot:CAMPEP_0170971018 /NCGR_PEP_ID=MMETSP0735-20130129/44973_1 /TAXON_ID=186038 /ORGANISM="Fragilariopsis kerguelensis, Strain L26-C5" /LENGTH=342 /DNA_ID=CAMNT_0011390897 /DNA_START=55 /DNA_END=1083 /DNA_ORIENTATION=+